MYYNDHAPPHFHAIYGDHGITVQIDNGEFEGQFPRRALDHVIEWYNLHQAELAENWNRARDRKPLRRIEPLE